MPRSYEPVELLLVVHNIDGKENAWLVSDTGERDNAVWLPKSVVEMGRQRATADVTVAGIPWRTREQAQLTAPIHEFLVPEWLAVERRLV